MTFFQWFLWICYTEKRLFGSDICMSITVLLFCFILFCFVSVFFVCVDSRRAGEMWQKLAHCHTDCLCPVKYFIYNNYAATLPDISDSPECVCVCVCVRERERERHWKDWDILESLNKFGWSGKREQGVVAFGISLPLWPWREKSNWLWGPG